jgi:TolB protein
VRTADAAPPSEAPLTPYENISNATQHTAFEVGETTEPCLTPDGKTLIFASNHHGKTFDIFAKDIGKLACVQITTDSADDRQPAVSPDGRLLAFVSNRKGNWDIYIKSLEESGEEVRLTGDESDDIHPSWSPDGTRIVYSTLNKRKHAWEIRIIKFEKGNYSIYSPGVEGLFPQWCPEAGSETILFQRPRGRDPGFFTLWTVESDGSKLTEVLESAQFAAVSPAWTADGGWLVFSTIRYSETPMVDVGNLWIVKKDGRYLTKIGKGADPQWEAACAPDGGIFFTITRGGVKNIWSIRPDYEGFLPEESRGAKPPAPPGSESGEGGKQT